LGLVAGIFQGERMSVVIRLESENLKTEFPLKPFVSVVVGRGSDSDCKISDPFASLSHCRLTLKADKLEIQDLSSKNGTFLNGIKVDRSDLYLGDVVKVGETRISLVSAEMETRCRNLLSFDGSIRKRLYHELSLDFTSVVKLRQPTCHFALPKAIRREEKESKRQELRNRQSLAGLLSNFLDIMCLMLVMLIPVYLMDQLDGKLVWSGPTRMTMLLVLEILALSAFYHFNFHASKFSIGERLGGIKKLVEA
jgi:hypothetical protein